MRSEPSQEASEGVRTGRPALQGREAGARSEHRLDDVHTVVDDGELRRLLARTAQISVPERRRA